LILHKNEIIHEKTYFGENAADHFIEHLIDIHDSWLNNALNTVIPLVMTESDNEIFNSATECYMCSKKFDENVKKIKDHNHFTGKYLGAACQFCNLQRQKPKELPIFLHNGSKYDFHFIIRALNRKKVRALRVLPYNSEHFRTISFQGFKFVDSLAFLQASLAQLSSDLSETDHKYEIFKQTDLIRTNGKLITQNSKLCFKKVTFHMSFVKV